ALVVLILFWRRLRTSRQEIMINESVSLAGAGSVPSTYTQEPAFSVMKRILYYSIPICLGAMVLPLLQVVDAFTLVKGLVSSGWELESAKDWRGVYDRGQPLVQFAAFFAT